jgi:hypothetical protein
MDKLNAPRSSALPYLWWSLACFAAVAFFVSVDADELESAAAVLGPLGMLFFGIFVFQASSNGIHRTRQLIALNTLPDVPPAIQCAPIDLFNPQLLPQVTRSAPVLSKRITKFFDNQKAMAEHVAYLENIHTQVGAAMRAATYRYNTDHRRLEDQQIVLFRMAHQAAKAATKFEERFPSLKGDLTSVPQVKPPPTPQVPSIIAAADHAKRMANLEKGTTHGLARAGMEGARGNLALALTAAIAIAAVNVIQFQKMVRQMQDDHGKVKSYASRARADLEELARGHQEIVTVSHIVHQQSTELRKLMVWAQERLQEMEANVTEPGNTWIEQVRQLEGYALLSRLQAARAV